VVVECMFVCVGVRGGVGVCGGVRVCVVCVGGCVSV